MLLFNKKGVDDVDKKDQIALTVPNDINLPCRQKKKKKKKKNHQIVINTQWVNSFPNDKF